MFGRPDVTIISYVEMLHIDDKGIDCHGINDLNNEPWAHLTLSLSTECKAYIEDLLEMDWSVDAIMDRHRSDPYFVFMLLKDSFLT